MSRKERVVAAMSGGVDSAVAAGLLVEAGYDVVGITMKMYAPTKPAHAKSCCGADDFDDARRSAQTLGIPHYVLDFEETFRRNVIDRFATDYATGRTPNPCVACNNFVKMGTLRSYATRIGARYIATGHYARLEQSADGPHLFRGTQAKDQAYALAQLGRDQLAGLLLPLGALDKAETRAHAGIANYTVGQRRGLPANVGEGGTPRYVTRIDPKSNTIVIGREDELGAFALIADEVNLIRPEHFAHGDARVLAMTRYRQTPAAATVTLERDALRVRFDDPHTAIAPGQLVALFDTAGDEVLGAATIREVL
jgi:tRNA-specific 2-thiouridylase